MSVLALATTASAWWHQETTPPKISISSPVTGDTVSGNITVSGVASDNVRVAAVKVKIDAGSYSLASGTTTWSFALDTTTLTDGTHTIRARAVDSSGNTATTSVSVTTSNTVPAPLPPPITPTSTTRQLGVTLPWSSSWLSNLDSYASMVGGMPSMVQTFRDMSTNFLNLNDMNGITSRGATPIVTLEPQLWSGSSTDPAYSLKNIANGNFDSWFASAADQSAAYGTPFYLRFAPEMNGAWNPWGAGINGNTPQDFIDAWRHVHAIFVAHGATNVKWVWAPNALGGVQDFLAYYPGSDVVNVLGLDGYNWGTLDVWQTWTQVFGPSYDELVTLDPNMPIMIAETASNESGGNKASWITSAYMTEIPTRTPRVQMVVWFNLNKEADWRVESSAASLTAFQGVVASGAWK